MEETFGGLVYEVEKAVRPLGFEIVSSNRRKVERPYQDRTGE